MNGEFLLALALAWRSVEGRMCFFLSAVASQGSFRKGLESLGGVDLDVGRLYDINHGRSGTAQSEMFWPAEEKLLPTTAESDTRL